MLFLANLCAVCLAWLFGVAAVTKLQDFGGLRRQLALVLPAASTAAIGGVVVAAELVVAALLISPYRSAGAIGAAVCFTAFAGYVLRVPEQEEGGCGCLGSFSSGQGTGRSPRRAAGTRLAGTMVAAWIALQGAADSVDPSTFAAGTGLSAVVLYAAWRRSSATAAASAFVALGNDLEAPTNRSIAGSGPGIARRGVIAGALGVAGGLVVPAALWPSIAAADHRSCDERYSTCTFWNLLYVGGCAALTGYFACVCFIVAAETLACCVTCHEKCIQEGDYQCNSRFALCHSPNIVWPTD